MLPEEDWATATGNVLKICWHEVFEILSQTEGHENCTMCQRDHTVVTIPAQMKNANVLAGTRKDIKRPCGNTAPVSSQDQAAKNCFPGLSRTCKDQIPGFSRTYKTRFQGLSRINSVHKHGCIRSKKCTYQISYRCNCITVTVFLKFKLIQKVTNCTHHFAMNFFSS